MFCRKMSIDVVTQRLWSSIADRTETIDKAKVSHLGKYSTRKQDEARSAVRWSGIAVQLAQKFDIAQQSNQSRSRESEARSTFRTRTKYYWANEGTQ